MWQSPYGIIGGLGLGIGPITDEQWGTRWYGQGFAAEVFPLEDASLQWQSDYPDQVWRPPAQRRLPGLTAWSTAWPSVVPTPPAVPELVAIQPPDPVWRARTAPRSAWSEDLSWDLISVASARYPSQFPRLRALPSGSVGSVEPIAAAPVVPDMSAWSGQAPAAPPVRTGAVGYQALGEPTGSPPEGIPELSWQGSAPSAIDRRVGRTAGSGVIDPLPLGTVRVEWIGEAPAWLARRRPPVTLGGLLVPAPLGTVLLDWFRSIGDSPIRPQGRPQGGLTAPVEAPAPAAPTEWRGDAPAWVRGPRQRLGGGDLRDPAPPAAAPTPDVQPTLAATPIRRPFPWASLTRGAVGSGAIDVSATARPAFGGQQIPGWRTIQYTGLVGSLFVEAAQTPQILAWRTEAAAARRRAAHAGGGFGRIDPPTPPPGVPDLIGQADPLPVERVGRFLYQAWGSALLPLPSAPAPLGIDARRVDLTYGVWRFPYQAWAGPIKPAVDPPAPTAPFSLYPGVVQPVLRRRIARLGGVVAPIRLPDVTAQAPLLSWDGEYAAWIARRRPTATGVVATSWASVIPFQDPSRFGWRGEAPTWIARRRLTTAAHPQGILATPVQFPIPETSWLGEFPDWIAAAGRVLGNGGTFWEPNDRPNPPSPPLAWGPSYPDQLLPAARPADRIWHAQPPRVIAFVPDLVGGLMVVPDRIARRTLPAAAARVWTDRFDIVIPDLRRDWSPSYPDRLDRPASLRARQSFGAFTASVSDRAVSPLDWYTNERDNRVAVTRRVSPPVSWVQPPDGSLVVISEYGWAPVIGVPWAPSSFPVPAFFLVLTPDIAAGAVTCVELMGTALTAPGILADDLTVPAILHGQLTTAGITQGDLC